MEEEERKVMWEGGEKSDRGEGRKEEERGGGRGGGEGRREKEEGKEIHIYMYIHVYGTSNTLSVLSPILHFWVNVHLMAGT